MPIDKNLLELITAGKFKDAQAMLTSSANALELVEEEKTGETVLHKMAGLAIVEKALSDGESTDSCQDVIKLIDIISYASNPGSNTVHTSRAFIKKEIVASGENAISLAIIAGNEQFALHLLKSKDYVWFNKKHLNDSYLHYAAAFGRAHVIDALIKMSGPVLLDSPSDQGRNIPLSIALLSYRKNPSIFNMSILTQLLYANYETEKNARRELYEVTLNGNTKQIWQHAIEFCIQRDNKSKPREINLYLLDFIERAVKQLNYDMEEMLKYILSSYDKNIQTLFKDALKSQNSEYAIRTTSIRTLNPYLRSIKALEMRTVPTNKNAPHVHTGSNLTTSTAGPSEVKAPSTNTDATAKALSGMNNFWNKYKTTPPVNNEAKSTPDTNNNASSSATFTKPGQQN